MTNFPRQPKRVYKKHDATKLNHTFADVLRSHMQYRSIDAQTLSEAVNVPYKRLLYILRGHRPTEAHLLNLCLYMGLDVDAWRMGFKYPVNKNVMIRHASAAAAFGGLSEQFRVEVIMATLRGPVYSDALCKMMEMYREVWEEKKENKKL